MIEKFSFHFFIQVPSIELTHSLLMSKWVSINTTLCCTKLILLCKVEDSETFWFQLWVPVITVTFRRSRTDQDVLLSFLFPYVHLLHLTARKRINLYTRSECQKKGLVTQTSDLSYERIAKLITFSIIALITSRVWLTKFWTFVNPAGYLLLHPLWSDGLTLRIPRRYQRPSRWKESPTPLSPMQRLDPKTKQKNHEMVSMLRYEGEIHIIGHTG